MNTTLSKLLLVGVLLLSQLACSGAQNMSQSDAQQAADAPIRVLLVTTTHGFRHGPAIDAAKAVMSSMEQTAGLKVDMTEDVSDFNPAKLAGYDVLFLANATLRVADDLTESEKMAIADPMKGDWGNYDIAYEGFRGTTEGKLAISGTPEALTGNIMVGNATQHTVLSEVKLEGQQLTFSWPIGNNGSITAVTMLDGDDMKGSLTIRDNEREITGVRTGPDENDTAGQMRVTADQRAAILEFVESGKGLVVAHAGLDAFYEWDAYREMVGGGLFQSHPWTQEVGITVEEKDNPAMMHFGDNFTINDEIYVLDQNPRWNARVLASLDLRSVGVDQGPANGTPNDHPIAWVRKQKEGRVFVTKLGHFAEVWQSPGYQEHILKGIQMVAGKIPAKFGGHRVKEVISEGVWPDDIAVDEKGNVWIAELRGKVHRYDAESGETRQLAQLATTDPTGIEHGLYGIEIDPNFYDGEPYLYLFMAEPESFINTLYRYEYRNDAIDFSTEKIILRVPTEPQCCHQAGDLEWGPDGSLYISTGDTGYSGTRPDWEISEEQIEAFKTKHNLKDFHWSRLVDSEATSQNLTDLRGKILRINKDGTIPQDNPFFGKEGVRWEIYAYGLRNPYRFKVDPMNGALYIGVVGPDAQYDYDEYNISESGGENFGWPRSIGKLFYNEWTPDMIDNYVPPIWEYTYEMGGRSATVGPIYRNDGPNAFPASFQNKVFVYDWSRRWIKYADIVDDLPFTNDTGSDVRETPIQVNIPGKRLANIKTFDQLTLTTPISMEMGPDGSIYVAEFDGFWDAGPNARVTRYRWVAEEEEKPMNTPAQP